MSSGQLLRRVKAATVAIVAETNVQLPSKQRPFTIVGSGFCVDREGIIVTCRHVHYAFLAPDSGQQAAKAASENDPAPFKVAGIPPQVLFVHKVDQGQVLFAQTPVLWGETVNKYDLAVYKIGMHEAFREEGYPTVDIADFADIDEGMDIATCGYPLGDTLYEQLGSVTSSFTRGHLSAILPAPGVPKEHVNGFQLDITATHGNSGGPVFDATTGKVFGVLQGGVIPSWEQNPQLPGKGFPGIAKAEAIYPIIDDGTVQRLKTFKMPAAA